MKFSFAVKCGCGETFAVDVTGTQFPKSAQCSKCHSMIWLVEPLGNVVGMAILARAATELTNGDWTLAIVLGAMAVECDLVYLFMKWKRIDLVSTGMLSNADEEEWEKQWRDDARTIAARLDKVSSLLTGKPFDSFLSHNAELLQTVQTWYPKNAASQKDFFIKGLFHRRNRVVHFGDIDFKQADAEMCVTLATTLSQILTGMDAQRRRALDAKLNAAHQEPL